MIYNLFTFFIWAIISPFIALFSFKKKYRQSLPARFFLYKNPKLKSCDVHFHACSLGEVNSIATLTKHFESKAITTITQTGFLAAKKIDENSAFLPFENFIPFWLNKSHVLVIFEAELWLNLTRYARKNGSYTILLNARISDKSYKKYLKFRFYYKLIFENIDLVLAQSPKDAKRLSELGARDIKVLGNIKSALLPTVTRKYDKFSRRTIVIASTHEGEEELVLANLKYHQNDKIILVPRHPERFKKAGAIFEKWSKENNLSYEKFSQNLALKSDCILIDALGELVNFYAISDVVILCGSFLDGIGGHNPIEAAQFECPIISGKFYHNQHALYELVENIKIVDVNEINEILAQKLPKTAIKNRCNLDEIINLIKEKI